MLENIHGLQHLSQKNSAIMESTDKICSSTSRTPEQQLCHSRRMEDSQTDFSQFKFILLLLFFKAAD